MIVPQGYSRRRSVLLAPCICDLISVSKICRILTRLISAHIYYGHFSLWPLRSPIEVDGLFASKEVGPTSQILVLIVFNRKGSVGTFFERQILRLNTSVGS